MYFYIFCMIIPFLWLRFYHNLNHDTAFTYLLFRNTFPTPLLNLTNGLKSGRISLNAPKYSNLFFSSNGGCINTRINSLLSTNCDLPFEYMIIRLFSIGNFIQDWKRYLLFLYHHHRLAIMVKNAFSMNFLYTIYYGLAFVTNLWEDRRGTMCHFWLKLAWGTRLFHSWATSIGSYIGDMDWSSI